MFNLAELILSGAILAAPAAVGVVAQSSEAGPVWTDAASASVEAPFNSTEALLKANQALNDLSTAKGRFTQIDAAGRFSTGAFYLNRPGRMRFEYDAPVPITLVSDGVMLAIEDRDLETMDQIPLTSTPLNLLLRKNTDLARHANILSVTRRAGLVGILLSDKSEESEGMLELFFDPETYDLRKWESVDATGQRTTVDLTDVEKGMKLSARLFRIEDPEDEDDRRR